MHPMQQGEDVASGRTVTQRGKKRCRMNGSPTNRTKGEQQPHANHCVHPPERNRVKSIPEIELPHHVEAREADDITAVRACHTKRRLDCAERL